MSLEGHLEDLSLAEIFQIIHLGKKSGVLIVESPSGRGRVVFQDGQILYASLDGVERIGERLIRKGLVKEKELEFALRIQKDRSIHEPLGAILAENRLIDKDVLEKILREQIKEVVYEILTWEVGSFKFEPERAVEEVPPGGSISPEYLILEGTRLKDEGARVIENIENIEEADHPLQIQGKENSHASTLISLLEEISVTASSTEVLLMVLRFAGEVLNRSVLFIIRDDHAEGFGQVGLASKSGDQQKIKALKIPLHKPSLISYAVQKKSIYKGPIPEADWNDYIVKHVGEGVPTEVFVAPFIEGDRVIAVLYGDNLLTREPIGDTAPIEAFIKVAGIVLLASKSISLHG